MLKKIGIGLLLSALITSLAAANKVAPPTTAGAALSPANPAGLTLAIMRAYQNKRKKIIIPPGVYHLPDPAGPYYITLSNMKNFQIIANGVTLLRSDPMKGGIIFDHCRRVTLTGLTLLCNPRSYTQGRITNIGPKWLDYRICKGYSADLNNILGLTEKQPGPFCGDIFSARTLSWKAGTGDMFFTDAQRIGPRTFRLAFPARPAAMKIGDLLKFNGAIHRDIRIQDCSHLRISRVTILGGTGFGILEASGDGNNRYDHITIKPPPKPTGADVIPLVANNGDGFHSVGVRHGPTLLDCYFDRTNDDGIAIHGYFSFVQRCTGKILIARCPTRIRPNDKIQIFDSRGGYLGEARVISLTQMAGYKPKRHITHRRRYQFFTGRGPFYRLTLSRSISSGCGFGSYISDVNANGSGFVIRNCIIKNNRAHGILIKANYGVIEGCTLEDNTMVAIDIRPMPYYWDEAGCSSHILILNNTIKHCGYFNVGAHVFGAGALSVVAHTDAKATKFGHNDIQIANNHFVDNDGINMLITDSRHIVVLGNTFVHPMQKANNRGVNFHFGTSDLIWLQQCKNILLAGNRVIAPGPAMKKLIGIGPDTRGIRGIQNGVKITVP